MSITDTFTRADSALTLGSTESPVLPWTAHNGVWGIGANQAAFISGGTANDRNATVDAGVADGTVSIAIGAFGGADNMRLVFRWSDNSNYWILSSTAAAAWDVYKRVAGAFTLAGSGGAGIATGDVLSVVLSGSAITAKVNGVAIVTATDAFNSTATRHGIGCNTGDTTNRWDNFSVTA